VKRKYKTKRRGRTKVKPRPQVQMDKAEYHALVLRSKTLAALGMGGGLPCAHCGECLVVHDRCPGCGKASILKED
jgi:hypothetical protein